MAKKTRKEIMCDGPDFAIGAAVELVEHLVWKGYAGRVVSVKDHKHLIKATAPNGATFHAEACGSQLQPWLFEETLAP